MKVVERAVAKTGSNRRFNLSSYFLLPIINQQAYRLKGFINSYLYNIEDIDKNLYNLYVLMDNCHNHYLNNHSRYIEYVEADSGYLYSFDISDYKDDVELFIKGKYSKLSDELVDILLLAQNGLVMNSQIYKIIYRTEDKRLELEELIGQKLPDDAELCSICDIEEETFYE